MQEQMTKKNGEQDSRLSTLETLVKFINNDFKHLRKKVDWLFGTVLILGVVGIAIQLWLK